MSALDDLVRLGQVLDTAGPDLARLDEAYSGRSPLSFLAPEIAAQVGTRLRSLSVNFARLVADSIAERLAVEGFRVGAVDPPPDPDPREDELWRIWRRSGMHLRSGQAMLDALVLPRAYASVWTDSRGLARIAVESARQTFVEHSPSTGERTVAVKRWTQSGLAHAVVFSPMDATRFRSLGAVFPDPSTFYPTSGWEQVGSVEHNLGVVPVIPLVNRARTLAPDGESELADVLGLCDAVAKLCTDMMVASEAAAMPRRWGTGIVLPETPDGEVDTSQAFNTAALRVWLAEEPDAKLGQFAEARLEGFTNSIELLVGMIGAVSGLPPHFLGLKSAAPRSAAERRSSESSLVKRTILKQECFGGAWAEVAQLAAVVESGHPRPDLDALEVVWRSPETRTRGEEADAAAKLVESRIVTVRQARRDLGFTSSQIEAMAVDDRADALNALGADLSAVLP